MPAKNNAIWKTGAVFAEAKELLSKTDSIIVFDLETTGFSRSSDRIIEIAAIRYLVDEDYTLQEQCVFHQYLNPGRALPEEITAITGITEAMLAGQPTEEEVFYEVQDFFDGDLVAGYNIAAFDVKFMEEYYGRNGAFFSPPGIVDCIKLARNLLNKGSDVENFKLETVGAYFGLKFQAHSAVEDARTTAKLLQIFLKEYAQQAKAPAPVTPGTLCPEIVRIAFWEGFKGFSRIYVTTNFGSLYYDIRSNCWGGKDLDVSEVNMPALEAKVFALANVKNEGEFAQFRGELSVAV